MIESVKRGTRALILARHLLQDDIRRPEPSNGWEITPAKGVIGRSLQLLDKKLTILSPMLARIAWDLFRSPADAAGRLGALNLLNELVLP